MHPHVSPAGHPNMQFILGAVYRNDLISTLRITSVCFRETALRGIGGFQMPLAGIMECDAGFLW